MSQETKRQFKAKIVYARLVKKELNKEPFTNSDKIRLMTDKELAIFLNETAPYQTYDQWLKWLRTEAPQVEETPQT